MEIRTLRQVVDSELARLASHDGTPLGLPSGFGLERRVPGGIPRDKVTTLFADSGNFKTTIKNHMLVSMALQGHTVIDFSLEDTGELTADRYLARYSGVPYGEIAGGLVGGDQVTDLQPPPAAMEAAERIWVVDDIEPSIDNILEVARACKRKRGLSAIAIDYIQLLSGRGNLKDVLDEAVVKCQRFANSEKVAVVLVSQQNKESETRDDPRPRMQDAFGSSAMRTGSKLIVALFRPFLFAPSPSTPKGPYGLYARYISANPENAAVYRGILEAWVLKNVLGRAQCALHLRVHEETGVVENYDDQMRSYL